MIKVKIITETEYTFVGKAEQEILEYAENYNSLDEAIKMLISNNELTDTPYDYDITENGTESVVIERK